MTILSTIRLIVEKFDFGETPEEIEQSRQVFLMRFFTIVGSMFMLPLGIYSLMEARTGLGIILLLATLIFLFLLRFCSIQGFLSYLRQLYSLLVAALLLYLLYTGGANGTGIYFCFSLSMVIISFSGNRFGMPLSAVLILLIALLIYDVFPGSYDYPPEHRSRIVLGFWLTFMMMLIFEWMRLRSYGALSATAETRKQEAVTDSLTGALNRSGLISALNDWPKDKFPASIVILDLDHFKKVNDQHGHHAGDLALITLAQTIRKHVKGGDLFARWGGEEFALVLSRSAPHATANVISAAKNEMEQAYIVHGSVVFSVTFSAGIAPIFAADELTHALSMADGRLYEAKESGRNKIVFSDFQTSEEV